MATHEFAIGDYVVFGLTIVISIGIGIYYAFSGGRQRTTSEYLVGGRTMSFIPVAISLMVSFESSIMMLGLPAEAYVYGIQYIFSSLGFLISQLLSVHIVVPLLHPLKITSAYEYLELRFKSRGVRLLGTIMGMLTYTWYMGIVLFGPAIALEAVTGFPLWGSIFTIELVAVIYTSIGGLKAVIWTDVFQALVMFLGIFSILIKGTLEVGGPDKVWHVATEGGRMNFFDFDPDPRTRHTFWNLFVGSLIRGFGLGFNQSTVQRISSTKTVSEAKRMLYIVAPCFFVSLTLACYEGIVAYAYYQVKQCDPFASKQLTDPNQIIPFVVMDIFAGLPGMPGLFLASLFSASLSTLSSGLSSLSALLWADIVHPIVGPNISEWKATFIAKLSVLMFGVIACGVAILVSMIGGTLTQIAGSLISAFAGPLTGLFFLGCFFPRSNAKGAIMGGITGLAFAAWLSIGISFSPNRKKTPWLPAASTDSCYLYGVGVNETESLMTNTTDLIGNWTTSAASTVYTTVVTAAPEPERVAEGVEKLYTLSYLWISVLGTLATVCSGLLGSLLTGMNKPGDVDPRYLISMSESLLVCFPGPLKKFLSSMGPQYIKEEYKMKFPDPAAQMEKLLPKEIEFESLDPEVPRKEKGDEANTANLNQVVVKSSPPEESNNNNNIVVTYSFLPDDSSNNMVDLDNTPPRPEGSPSPNMAADGSGNDRPEVNGDVSHEVLDSRANDEEVIHDGGGSSDKENQPEGGDNRTDRQ